MIFVKNDGNLHAAMKRKYDGLLKEGKLYVSYNPDGTVDDFIPEEILPNGKYDEERKRYSQADQELIDKLFETSQGRASLFFSRKNITFDERNIGTQGFGIFVVKGLSSQSGGKLMLFDDGRESGKVVFAVDFLKEPSKDSIDKELNKPEVTFINQKTEASLQLSGERSTGGIDLTPANMNLQTQNAGAGEGIKFHLDPALMKQLQNAAGFVPVIINIQPMQDLRRFLGVDLPEITHT
jgi:hypothetical protein